MDTYNLKIIADIHCEVFIDGDYQGIARKNSLTKFPLKRGEYQVLFRSTVNQSYFIEMFLFIEYDRLLNISFCERFKSRDDLIQDSDIRMVRSEFGHKFRNLVLGFDLPGEFRTQFGMDYKNDEETEELNRFHEGLAVVRSMFNYEPLVIDSNGQVIAKNFQAISIFQEGLAGVFNGQRYGFIDKTGKITINLQFDEVGLFNCGLARVLKDGKWGYINKQGEFVIPCRFDSCNSFQDGYAIIENNSKQGLINSSGVLVISDKYDRIQRSDNSRVYLIQKDNKFGADSISGEILLPCQYDYIKVFKSNARVACVGMNGEHFLINDGQTIKLESDSRIKSYSFFSNKVLMRIETGHEGWYSSRMCLCNLHGQRISEYYDYSSGHVVNRGWSWDTYYRGGGVFGFINDDGQEYIECKYQEARNFSEELASVNKGGSFPPTDGPVFFKGGKWGYINTRGEEVVPFLYDSANSFFGGAALVRIGQRSFYIDKYGNEL